ncbi:MAG TPA: sugar phosphate isomerase/epimerase family protein [Trebonia sp.]|nr:sugar phosphate isomerase/epimerase family protein [Trebonia sp.]
MSTRDVYLSFFMFTIDLRPDDPEYTKVIVRHMKELRKLGYTGFDMPIFPTGSGSFQRDVRGYARLREALDKAGLGDVGCTTNVATTRTFDPTSEFAEQRRLGLEYLKSRVDITAALRGTIMAGPVLFPYNVFPVTDLGDPLWSDALQDWLEPRYRYAKPVMEELGEYAESRCVKVAIEPVDHWETPAPNMLSDVLGFLGDVNSRNVGVCVDSAHVVLGSIGPATYRRDVDEIARQDRLHYVQISAPDRGEVKDSWIPWREFLEPVLPRYDGPLLIEVFNAVPPFPGSLRLTRRKFWIPGADKPVSLVPNAYDVARDAIDTLGRELGSLR